MKLYMTGDTHGAEGLLPRLDRARLQPDDTLVVLGDFGVLWGQTETDDERDALDAISQMDGTILWIDGNHENFERIAALDEGSWHGHDVKYVRDNIIYLPRGHVYRICGMDVFCMGGGMSIDKAWRTPYVSWWPQEVPTEEELRFAESALDEAAWNVDEVWTHCPPATEIKRLCYTHHLGRPMADMYAEWLQWIADKLRFEDWWYGHMHIDEKFDAHSTYHPLYEDIVEHPKTRGNQI